MTTRSTSRAFTLLLKRDLTLAYRQRSEMINPLLFFVLVTALFPLGIGADPALLRSVGPWHHMGGCTTGSHVVPGQCVPVGF